MSLKVLNFFCLLMLAKLVAAVNPGSYIIANVQFPNQRVAGSGTTTEGIPLLTFRVRHTRNLLLLCRTLSSFFQTPPGDEINSNGVVSASALSIGHDNNSISSGS